MRTQYSKYSQIGGGYYAVRKEASAGLACLRRLPKGGQRRKGGDSRGC